MKRNSVFLIHLSIVLTLPLAIMAQGPQVSAVSVNSNTMVARSPDSRGWTDPALNHNKLLQQQTADGTYKIIGQYKVIGSPYLFGERHKGHMFSGDTKAYNIFINYNTFNQEVEFYSTSNPGQSLIREVGTLDSFILLKNESIGIEKDLKFVYGSILGSKEKLYYQELATGEKYSLYKRYKSELGYSTVNIAQSELRQFDLLYDYFYLDISTKKLKKIKAASSVFVKEFKDVKDLSGIINNEEFITNPEKAMVDAIDFLNK